MLFKAHICFAIIIDFFIHTIFIYSIKFLSLHLKTSFYQSLVPYDPSIHYFLKLNWVGCTTLKLVNNFE